MASFAASLARRANFSAPSVLGASPSSLLVNKGRALPATNALHGHFFSGGSFEEKKEEFKHREWPDKGTTIQEGAEETRAAAEQAGYERAREDGERVREADTLKQAMREGASMVSDAAKGVGEFMHKVADMSREAAGRGVETAKGLGFGSDKGDTSGGSVMEGASQAYEQAKGKVGDMGSQAQQTYEQAKGKLGEMGSQAQQTYEQTKGKMGESASQAQQTYEQAKGRVGEAAGQARQDVKEQVGASSQAGATGSSGFGQQARGYEEVVTPEDRDKSRGGGF